MDDRLGLRSFSDYTWAAKRSSRDLMTLLNF